MAANTSRRNFAMACAAVPLLGLPAFAGEPRRRPRVAVIYTTCYHRSHAHVILENFLRPYLFNGRITAPSVDVVSLYADQPSKDRPDLTGDIARQFRLPVHRTIADALTLRGKELAVDAVLSIGEHGDYPTNKLGQQEYPRKRFFDEAVAVMQQSRRFVPFFNDKHLSFRWDWAREMYDTAQRLRIPLMAGSSVPLATRRPEFDLPANSVIDEAVSVHGGPLERYDFHGLEVLQSIVETRRGGETGVRNVEFLQGDALMRAAQQGRWSLSLAEAALALEFGEKLPDLRRPLNGAEPHGMLVTYRDGLRATVLRVGLRGARWHFACRLANEQRPRATSFYVGPWNNRCLFMALSNAIQHFFNQRVSPYPVERTLLTTGALDAALRSRSEGRRLETPNLQIAYAPRDFRAFREMGPSWKLLPEDAKEPMGITDLPVRR